MSLRIFHVVFIVASIALSAFVGGWGFWRYSAGGGGTDLVLALLFLACGAALVGYAAKAFQKLREVS